MPKRGHLWPIRSKAKSKVRKWIFCLSTWIIFDFKIVEKTELKTTPYYYFYIWFKNKQVWTSLDRKIRIWQKSTEGQKVLDFYSKTFCFSDLFCQTKIQKVSVEKRPSMKALLALQFFIQIGQRFLKLRCHFSSSPLKPI